MRTLVFILCSVIALCTQGRLYAQGIITTIAGNGITQYIGDGAPATNYSLAYPAGICADQWGNIYEADYAVARVRKLTPAGEISTYAGTGMFGYTGNGGPATNANIRDPAGVAIDKWGNLFVLEEYNNTVRRIDATTGIITTVCGNTGGGYGGDGGPATAAQMEQPAGLCLDKAGNIYIADKGNHRIRRVDAATGIITTIAGTGASGYAGDGGYATTAVLNSPAGVCVDTSGNIYIADRHNNAVRKIVPATGVITTFAGTGAADYTGDWEPATAATLVQPNSVHMSKRNNLYISDFGNNRVRVVTSDGIMHTLAGSGLYGFYGDGGPALSATFGGPTGVCADDMENVYIADGGNSAIRKVTPVYNSVNAMPGPLPVAVFPNPSSGILRVELPSAPADGATVTVCNAAGGAVLAFTHYGHRQLPLDLSACLPGIYFLRVQWHAGSYMTKITIVR